MAKTVLPSKLQEWRGLDRITQVVHEMGCIFRELSKDDYGIDGEIEVVEPKADGTGLAATGGIIKVQAKSGQSYVTQDSETRFVTPVSRSDLDLWYNATFPVLYIVYHPKDDCLYIKEVRSYVRSAENIWHVPHHIAYDKASDRFTAESYLAIRAVAHSSPPRVSFQEQERLYSNLLLVKRTPGILTYAQTTHTDPGWIRSQVVGGTPPFRLLDGRLYTIVDLRDQRNPLRSFCDSSHISDLPADTWVIDEVRRRDYVSLLNQLLSLHLRRCGLRYNRHFDRDYFPRLDDTSTEFAKSWFNVRTKRNNTRRVVRHYTYGGQEFWRHTAMKVSLRYVDPTWLLQIDPKYLFTSDGKEPYDRDRVGPLTTRLRALERNAHGLNHVLFWSDVMSQGRPAIEIGFGPRALIVAEKEPLSGIAKFAIPSDPATYEEESEEGNQLSFFGSPEGADAGGGDDFWD